MLITYTNNTGGNYSSGDWWQPTSSTIYWSGTYPKYFYQVFCPAKGCKTPNWAELNSTITCRKCGATIRAVDKAVDYEVEIEK